MNHEAEAFARHYKLSRNVSIILGILFVVVVLLLVSFSLLYVSYRTSVDSYRSSILLGKTDDNIISIKGLELPDNTSNIVKPLNNANLISVVAKNQPAVVRILTIRCADIILKLDLDIDNKDVCTAGVGSGSIISSDGYISTNGHVIDLPDHSLVSQSITSVSKYSEILEYLYSQKLISYDMASGYLRDLSDNNKMQDAATSIVKLIPKDRIILSNQNTTYSVQISNEPVRLDTSRSRMSVRLADSIKEAKFIDKDFNLESAEQALAQGKGFDSSDVALLKIDGDYPYINLGTINNLSLGDQLIAIGYPAFVDGSVDTSKWQTVPSVTQGIVKKIGEDSSVGSRKLIISDVQVAQGSSGGPALDINGDQIGLNTYANIECADLMCFGDATIRDIADIKALLDKNNIVLKKDSAINEHWYAALKSYNEGDFVSALSDFEWIEDNYSYNYLSSSLAKTTRSQLGTSADISPKFASLSNIYQISIIVLSVFVMMVAVSISLVRYINVRHRSILLQMNNKNISR